MESWDRRRRHTLNVAGIILVTICVLSLDARQLKQFSWSSDQKALTGYPPSSPSPAPTVAPRSSDLKSLLNTSNLLPHLSTTELSPAPKVVPRWNVSQLDQHFENLTTFDDADLLQLWPKPVLNHVEVYNRDAWHRLRQLLGLEGTSSSSARKNVTTVCFSGGSSTAGGGGAPFAYRFNQMFPTLVNISQRETVEIRTVNRGHGGRSSPHTAFLLPNFISAEDTDILVWEFSQNDGGNGCSEMNKGLTTWLDHVKNYFTQPPLVILVYLWSPPFKFIQSKIVSKVSDCHHRIGARYDFVVGSVNGGAYVESLGWDFPTAKKRLIADYHHPNRWGHWMIAFMLWDLVTDEERSTVSIDAMSPPEEPLWNCTHDSEGVNRILDIANNQFALASWTGEAPRNDRHQYGMMYPKIMTNAELTSETAVEKNITTILNGKAASYRKDRQYSIVLPCCHSDEHMVFDVPGADDGDTKGGAKGLAAGIQGGGTPISAILFRSPEVSELTVHYMPTVNRTLFESSIMIYLLDAQGEKMFNGTGNSTAGPEWVVIDAQDGTCRFTYVTYHTWLLLPEAEVVSKVLVCNKNPSCGAQGSRRISLMQLILF